MIKKILIAGCLVWLPLIATIWVIQFVVGLLDDLFNVLPVAYQPDTMLGMHIPGLGLVLAIVIVLITGSLVTNFLGDKLMYWWDGALKRIPLIGAIYSTVKQVLSTLVAADGQSFRKVLLVEFPHPGSWSIGFQTGQASDAVNKAMEQDMLSVFIPTTPNPTSGFLLMVPKDQVRELDMSVEEAFKTIVSLGTLKTDELPLK